jgi:endonuclease/exonuclease/phosphatase family metal-dependent hydrolase
VPAFTFPADSPTRRLDYIFFGRALTRISAEVVAPPPGPHSDHLPIFAELELR